MIDEAVKAEVGVRPEESGKHPVWGFMLSFADSMREPAELLNEWEVEPYLQREVESQVDRFVEWFEKTWFELGAENTITNRAFEQEVEVIPGERTTILRHTPTGMEVLYPQKESEFVGRSRLKNLVMDLFNTWREAGNPLRDLDSYRVGVIDVARKRLLPEPVAV